MPVKIAIVVQRYGTQVVGGAELHTRQVAEQLHQHLGWEVDVYTTTAQDYMTWANAFQPGVEVIAGVRVHRFNCAMQRAPCFGLYDRLTRRWMPRFRRRGWARGLAVLLEKVWILLQGPYCPQLLRALRRDQHLYQKIIFVTYLYYPTLAGVRHVKDKALLIPLAHDEPPFHFLIVAKMLQSVRSILLNTKPEQGLIQPKLGDAPVRVAQAGVGFDEALFVPQSTPSNEPPYVLYLGRISAGKGVAQLVEWFAALATEPRLKGLRLVLAGHKEASVTIPDDPRFTYLGFVDDDAKLKLMRAATALINPSPLESLSMIVIEAMALKVPVLVNANCDVLRYYTEAVPTARGFRDQASFNTELLRTIATDWQAPEPQRQLSEARTWALKTFSWAHILQVFKEHVLT